VRNLLNRSIGIKMAIEAVAIAIATIVIEATADEALAKAVGCGRTTAGADATLEPVAKT